ncbi:LOW QUALITY PROTEIN: myopalladin [Cololabis saira]|uniref:LOW QUALITY PROTEIN: myopalladin n=1 Tax=Cololabis saira TaxID=129043 RepID=UPI002AD24B0B|nr:LOW QUALITY PROTEIN: myopalladin [Cololabis saira]
MQENNLDQPPSLSQLLRENYLAEARAQQRHGDMSRSDASSSRLPIYGSFKGKSDDSAGHNDAQFPDLSAFLSQEELDKSVNLAQQAIGHDPREERSEVKASAAPLTAPSVSSSSVSSSTLPSIAFSAPPSAPDFREELAAHPKFTADRKVQKASSQRDGRIRSGGDSSEGFNDCNQAKAAPFGAETQSKKEFLNKAADFIEELSSLFKANSSKRVRPRSCKPHRSRSQSKSQQDELAGYQLGADNRERAVTAVEVEEQRAGPAGPAGPGQDPQGGQQDSGSGRVEFQESRNAGEEQFDPVSLEDGEQTESPDPAEGPYPAESEPPRFVQKLKSREVAEGSKVQLDCIVQGRPVPEVRWFCEDKELEDSPDIQIITSGELHSLVIAEAFEEDTGRYSCFASNFYGTDSTSAEIYVEGASSSESEGEQLFDHVAQLQRIQAKSSSSSSPPSQVLSADDESESSQAETVTDEPEEELSLPVTSLVVPETGSPGPIEISKPTHAPPEETAVLPVQVFPASSSITDVTEGPPTSLLTASAPQLEPTASPALPVPSAPPQQTSTSSHNYQPGLTGQAVMAAPVFTKSLQDLSSSEGQLVVLECRVKGVPASHVDWYREGKLIQDSPEFRILQKKPRSPAESEEICTLVIAEVFREDAGVFTCTANNPYGSVSCTAALSVTGKGNSISHTRPLGSSLVEPSRGSEVTVSSSIKPHSSTIRLDPLVSSSVRLDPLNTTTLRLEPHTSSMLRSSLPGLDPSSLSSSSLTSRSTSTPNLDPLSLHQDRHGSTGASRSGGQILSHPKPFAVSSALEAAKGTPNQNGSPVVVPLPDPPPNSCLKSGALTNHRDSRTSARVGLRVHFKLPEDEEGEDGYDDLDEELGLDSASKEPPPVLAKPKLDPAQLQLLHNQVLMEQQQETEPPTQNHVQAPSLPPFQAQIQPEVPSPREGPAWPPRMHRDPQAPTFSQQMPHLTMAPSAPSAPALGSTFPGPVKTSSLVTSPPPAPLLNPPAVSQTSTFHASQTSTFHASHLNLSPAALGRTAPASQFSSPPAPKLSVAPTGLTPAPQGVTSPTGVLRSTHASLMNLAPSSHTFNYARPKEFLAAQTLSPVRSPSPTESPVPLLQELAAEFNSSATSSPTPPLFSPTRVLNSPTSPPYLMSSPPPGAAPFLNSVHRAQSPPQASSPTSSSSSPSPIQNPVAFLSSVLPSLTPSQLTNSMGLPRGAPVGVQKKVPKTRVPSAENIRESKEILLRDIERKLRFKDDPPVLGLQQKLSFKGKTASRALGPNIPATVINYDEEYKVSNFEQRLMSEIEFRLERTPVEESDDEVKHDDVPTGKCIAPIFDKKLKNFKAMEGVPVTFSCKVVGIPLPKVYWFKDGKQILRKNVHYRKIREGDGTCALHIESTTSDDDGNYTIMASNPQGRISCSGHLIVQTGPPRNQLTPIHSQRVRTRVQEVESEQTQERFFRPHFLQAPADMTGHEGKMCRLDCKVSGLPNPELMWLVNGRPIYPDIYHKMLVRENGIHSLVIDPLTQRDAGTYTCIASNKAGQSSFNLELRVVEKERKHPPLFVEKLQNVGIPEGTPVRLECRVVGMPPPVIYWKKDNETITKAKDRIGMTQDATGYVCLLIQGTTKDDAGWYTVSAKNDAGIVSCTCRLDIYAQWHQSIPLPMRKAPRTGSRYAALTGQGLDIKSAFPTSDTSPILYASSPREATLESEEL